MSTYTSTIQQMYVAYFNRPADVSGLANWEAYAAGKSLDALKAAISAEFAKSAEYTIVFSGMTTSQIVTKVYQNLLGRDPDAPGLTNWINHLAAGTSTVSSLVTDVIRDAGAGDVDTIANKVSAATTFTEALDTVAEINGYSGAAANAVAAAWLSTVGQTAASLTAAIAPANLATVTTNVVANGGATGTTFTMTSALDTVTGTSNNDVINGQISATAASNTFAVTDTIAAGTGTDTLSLTALDYADGDNLAAATVTGIETLNIRAVDGTAADKLNVTAANFSGVTAVNSNLSTSHVVVTNLASGAAAGMIGNGSIANGAFNFGYKTTTDAATLNLSGGTTAGAVTITSDPTSVTINSTGAANTIGAVDLSASASLTSATINAATNLTVTSLSNDFSGAATDKLTVSGAATTVTLGTLPASLDIVDASGMTAGGIVATMSATTTLAITGGAGNDTITTGSVLTTGSVNAGSGTDILDLGTNVAHANTSSLAAKYTNFEALRVNGTFDASLISSITAIQLSGATNNISNMTATQAAAVTARADIGATTLALASSAGTSDVLSLTMGTGLTTSAATNAGALTINGFETLNVATAHGPTATTGANQTTTIASFVADKLTAINLTGTNITLTDAATTKATTINGSALTGVLTVSGTLVAGSSVTGGVGNDVFTLGAEGSTYTGGSGNDGFTTTAAILNADGTTDAVLAGGAGTDTITLTGAATLTDVHFTNVTGMEKLATAVTTAVSYTGLGAAFKAAYADGVTVTSGTLADGATYTFGAGLYDKAVTLTLVSSGDGATTADNIAITTGAAADTISVTAASWVGGAGAVGLANITTGAGIDTITVSHGVQAATVTGTASVTVNAGTGADVISATGTNHSAGLTTTFVVAAGDSLVSAYDSITGFDMGTGALFSSTLDFASVSLAAYTATAATGFTSAELTVAVSAAGLVTFAGTSASALTLAQKIAAVQSVVVTTAGDSALFTHGSNSYVFNNNATADSLVELVGITGTTLVTANATTAAAIFIA